VEWHHKALEFSSYFLTLLCPWNVETGCTPFPLSWEGFNSWYNSFRYGEDTRHTQRIDLLIVFTFSDVKMLPFVVLVIDWLLGYLGTKQLILGNSMKIISVIDLLIILQRIIAMMPLLIIGQLILHG
jgi:hypothetical protein